MSDKFVKRIKCFWQTEEIPFDAKFLYAEPWEDEYGEKGINFYYEVIEQKEERQDNSQ